MTKTTRLVVQLSTWILFLTSPLPLQAWTGDVGDVATIQSFQGLFENVLQVVLSLVGLSTFIMIIVGGFKYLTAGGDTKAVEAAQQTITMGIIGLALAVLAWVILFAIQGFTGVNLLEFNIGL